MQKRILQNQIILGGFPNIYVLENPPKMKNMCNENI